MMAKPKKHPAKSAARRGSHRKRLDIKLLAGIYLLLIIISALLALTLVGNRHRSTTLADPFSGTQRAAAGFALYYPSQLPAGYQLDGSSLNRVQKGIVTFRILNGNGSTISVTEQTLPANFNLSTFYNTFGDSTSIKASLGQVTSGSIDNNKTHLSSLMTADGTWLLVSSAYPIPPGDRSIIFEHLRLSH